LKGERPARQPRVIVVVHVGRQQGMAAGYGGMRQADITICRPADQKSFPGNEKRLQRNSRVWPALLGDHASRPVDGGNIVVGILEGFGFHTALPRRGAHKTALQGPRATAHADSWFRQLPVVIK